MEINELKKLTKTIESTIRVGKNGITTNILNELKIQLAKKGIVKVKFLKNFLSDLAHDPQFLLKIDSYYDRNSHKVIEHYSTKQILTILAKELEHLTQSKVLVISGSTISFCDLSSSLFKPKFKRKH